jgi:DNA invertase Pin-like site-specific DNA recombinase
VNEKSNVCVVYCRVSSDRQAAEDKGSLDDQEARCRAKAQALGLTILRVQRDAESAWVLDKRSQFQAVLKDARAGKFDVLVVDRMNRFVRGEDMADYMAVAVALREAGVEVVFAEKDYGSGAASQLMQYLDAYVSAGEQANRRKQIMGGKRTRVLRHRHTLPGSRPTYGYRWVDAAKTRAEFAVDEDGNPTESQRVVRRIWQHFLYGESPTLSGTAKMLNKEGIRSPREYAGVKAPAGTNPIGPRWQAETIRFMLHNEIYWGRRRERHGQGVRWLQV